MINITSTIKHELEQLKQLPNKPKLSKHYTIQSLYNLFYLNMFVRQNRFGFGKHEGSINTKILLDNDDNTNSFLHIEQYLNCHLDDPTDVNWFEHITAVDSMKALLEGTINNLTIIPSGYEESEIDLYKISFSKFKMFNPQMFNFIIDAPDKDTAYSIIQQDPENIKEIILEGTLLLKDLTMPEVRYYSNQIANLNHLSEQQKIELCLISGFDQWLINRYNLDTLIKL